MYKRQILTSSAPEGTTELFDVKYFDTDAYLSQSGQLYVKDSSLVSVLGITDIMFAAQTVRGSTALGLEPMIIASALYLVICLILNQILALFERRMRHDA